MSESASALPEAVPSQWLGAHDPRMYSAWLVRSKATERYRLEVQRAVSGADRGWAGRRLARWHYAALT